MVGRTVEDHLREEYFDLLPDVLRVTQHVEAEIKYRLLPVLRTLKTFEQLSVESRVKGCESAIESLRKRQDFATFNVDSPESYTLTSLKDLAGVRVLAFPPNRVREIDQILRRVKAIEDWTSDPVDANQATIAFKYSGHYSPASTRVKGEYQVVSLLTGRFWEVEHSAMYKPGPTIKDATEAPLMQRRRQAVLRELAAFEDEFERLVRTDPISGD
jgi:ppGpp synthetase/RelA/SpoT-type nucleotidyltranferase